MKLSRRTRPAAKWLDLPNMPQISRKVQVGGDMKRDVSYLWGEKRLVYLGFEELLANSKFSSIAIFYNSGVVNVTLFMCSSILESA